MQHNGRHQTAVFGSKASQQHNAQIIYREKYPFHSLQATICVKCTSVNTAKMSQLHAHRTKKYCNKNNVNNSSNQFVSNFSPTVLTVQINTQNININQVSQSQVNNIAYAPEHTLKFPLILCLIYVSYKYSTFSKLCCK